jgi:hypothetical protein
MCPSCPYECICGGSDACVGNTCEPRACVEVNLAPLAGCNDCLHENCCDDLESCALDLAVCIDDSGDIRDDTVAGRRLLGCVDLYCGPACITFCGTDLSYADEELTMCVDDNCCDELSQCAGEDEDWDGCVDCLNTEGGGPRCDAAIDCIVENCLP